VPPAYPLLGHRAREEHRTAQHEESHALTEPWGGPARQGAFATREQATGRRADA
jgi:hypothetical protein